MKEASDRFYSERRDAEHLEYTSVHGLIADILFDSPWREGEEVTIYRWQRQGAPSVRPDDLLEMVLGWMDEEHGDPENATEPTDAMKQAATAFCATMQREYVPWGCEVVEEMKVILKQPTEHKAGGQDQ